MNSALTAVRLRELLHYDRDTGVFTWRERRSNRAAGSIAGTLHPSGCITIKIDGVRHYAHRLAWVWMTGEWPIDLIDHEDTIPSNNRFLNLRQADRQLNNQNRRCAGKNNNLGLLGVGERSGLFRARIRSQGKNKHLGYFATPEEASAAYLTAKRVLHAGCTL